MDAQELIARAVKNTGATSRRELSKMLGIEHSMMVRWENGERNLQYDDALLLAHAAGLDPTETASRLRLPLTKNPKLKKVLQQLIRTAALCFVIGCAINSEVYNSTNQKMTVYYVKLKGIVKRCKNGLWNWWQKAQCAPPTIPTAQNLSNV